MWESQKACFGQCMAVFFLELCVELQYVKASFHKPYKCIHVAGFSWNCI